MSAYLCDASHLAAIAREIARTTDNAVDAEMVFGLLLDENLKSVGYRYPDATRIVDWFEDGEAAFVWEVIPEESHTATELDELVRSYQYQSCEHPEWKESTAYKATTLLRALLESRVQAEKDAEATKTAERARALSALPSLGAKETAAAIRKILRANFPATKFSVVTERGSMVSSVRISWTDGPTTSRVDSLVRGFKAGRFDGMTDSYDYDRDSVLSIDGTNYRPACRYIFTSRNLSPAFTARLITQVATYYGFEAPTVRVSSYDGSGSVQAAPEQDRQAWAKTSRYWSDLVHQASQDRTRFHMETSGR